MNIIARALDFLVVTGGKIAQFGGTATKDGQTGYYFRVKAIDNGEPGTLDGFWIKIWAGDIITAETTDPIYNSHNTLSGGNIQVRVK